MSKMKDIRSVSTYDILLIFFPNDLSNIIRNYVTALRPNQSMLYQDTQDVLLMDGIVESNSPKNRDKLYSFLQKNKIKYTTTIIGYTSGSRMLSRYPKHRGESWAMKWEIGRIMRWINQKRILPDDVSKRCTDMWNDNFVFNDIKEIFDKTISHKKRYAILKTKWGALLLDSCMTPFSRISLHKTIVRIQLI